MLYLRRKALKVNSINKTQPLQRRSVFTQEDFLEMQGYLENRRKLRGWFDKKQIRHIRKTMLEQYRRKLSEMEKETRFELTRMILLLGLPVLSAAAVQSGAWLILRMIGENHKIPLMVAGALSVLIWALMQLRFLSWYLVGKKHIVWADEAVRVMLNARGDEDDITAKILLDTLLQGNQEASEIAETLYRDGMSNLYEIATIARSI